MNEIVIKSAAGIVATVGFAIMFKLKPKFLPISAFIACLACTFYFGGTHFIPDNPFIVNIIASFAVAGVSEVFARICRVPSTVFLLPGCIPLVPGGSLYYGMNAILNSNLSEGFQYLFLTVEVGFAIAIGIMLSSLIRFLVNLITPPKYH